MARSQEIEWNVVSLDDPLFSEVLHNPDVAVILGRAVFPLGSKPERWRVNMEDQVDWQALSGEAMWCRHTGDLRNAIELMSAAIAEARKTGSLRKQVAIMMNYLADLHLLNGDPKSAEKVIRETLDCSKKLKILQLGDDLLVLSRILEAKGDFEAALDAAQQSLATYARFGHQHGVGQARLRIASLQQNGS